MGNVTLGTTFIVPFNTASGTGQNTVADTLPTAYVYVLGVGIIAYAPVVTHLSIGDYYIEVDATTGNGFALGQSCALWVHATVGGVSGSLGLTSFDVTDGVLDALLSNHTVSGSVAAGISLAAGASPSAIASAVLNSVLTGFATQGTAGDALAVAAGLLQGNFFMDNTNNTNSNGQTAARLRIFRTGTAASNATPGGTGEGEFATFDVETTYIGPNMVATHRVARQ